MRWEAPRTRVVGKLRTAEVIEEFKIVMSMPDPSEVVTFGCPPPSGMPDLPVEFTLDTLEAMNEEPIKADSVDDFFDAL